MKKETKEAVDYVIKDLTESVDGGAYIDGYDAKVREVIELLKRLPELEKNLTLGGFVRDRDGMPVKHGDKVLYERDGEEKVGAAYFDTDNLYWYLMTDKEDFLYLAPSYDEIKWFKKI